MRSVSHLRNKQNVCSLGNSKNTVSHSLFNNSKYLLDNCKYINRILFSDLCILNIFCFIKGDSGGPLVVLEPTERYVQAGKVYYWLLPTLYQQGVTKNL